MPRPIVCGSGHLRQYLEVLDLLMVSTTLIPYGTPAPLDELQVYAQVCDQATGVTVPDFSCDAGTLIPTTSQVG